MPARPSTSRWPGSLRWLAVVATGGMFLVLIMGAAVTNTGSAEGCGRSLPLCNGQLVPEFTISTAIEYSHRAVTVAEGVLVAALTAAMVLKWQRDRETLSLGLLMSGTLLLQAGLGAGAVMFPQSPLVLATHFGVSLVCFAATYLSAVVIFERTAPVVPARGARAGRLRPWVLGVGLYVLGVVYLGAYVRHAGLSLACVDWPLCNGQVVPSLAGPTAIVFFHRVAALGAVLLCAWLLRQARATRHGQRAAALAFGLVCLQALSGALVVWTRLGLFSTLAHGAIMALLFAALAHLLRLAVLAGRNRRSEFVSRRTSYRGWPVSARRWHSTHHVASGRACRRSGGIVPPHRWHTP